MTETLVASAVSLLVVYFVFICLVWRFQEGLVFQPPQDVARERLSAGQIWFEGFDGTKLFAYVVGEPVPLRPVVIAFHGNAEVARWLVPWAEELARRTGSAVVLPEYRGYDGLGGRPTYENAAADARSALGYVQSSLGISDERIVLFGHSLGSAIASELAADVALRALILQAPFSSAREMAGRMMIPGVALWWQLISRVHYDTITRVRTLRAPVWVAHGTQDTVVPATMGQAVFEAAAVSGELLMVRGAGHSDVERAAGDVYWRWLERAVRLD